MAQQGFGRPSPFGEGSRGLGYPEAGPPTSGPPSGGAASAASPAPPGPPGGATTAAVLGFVAAVVHGLLATWVLVGLGTLRDPGPTTTELAVVLVLVTGWTTISAMLAVGSLRLLQRTDRAVLVRGSITELVGQVLVVAGVWLFLDDRTSVAVTQLVVAGATVAAVRLVFLQRPAVTTWLTDPVEHPDDAPLRAILVPHALILTAVLLVFAFVA